MQCREPGRRDCCTGLCCAVLLSAVLCCAVLLCGQCCGVIRCAVHHHAQQRCPRSSGAWSGEGAVLVLCAVLCCCWISRLAAPSRRSGDGQRVLLRLCRHVSVMWFVIRCRTFCAHLWHSTQCVPCCAVPCCAVPCWAVSCVVRTAVLPSVLASGLQRHTDRRRQAQSSPPLPNPATHFLVLCCALL